MMEYKFNPDDAYEFARCVAADTRLRNNQLQFKYCPYCHGGQKPDKWTFAISMDTGAFNCPRGSCGQTGNMLTLAKEFSDRGFKIKGEYGEYMRRSEKKYKKLKTPEKIIESKPSAIKYLGERGISEWIVRKYGITTRKDNDNILVFPFFDENKQLTFIKYRQMNYVKGETSGSKEWQEPDCKPILFGIDHCDMNNNTIVLTEGQIDALSLVQAGIPNALSVPMGKTNFAWVTHCWEFVQKFETMIIFGDYENGEITLLDHLKNRFNIRVKHVRPEDYKDCKDANDILRKYGKEQIWKCIDDAEEVMMNHIIDLSTVEDIDIFEYPKLKTGITCLDKFLHGGLPFGGVTLIAGKPGQGKSTMANQIIANAINDGHTVLVYTGELGNSVFKTWFDMQIAGSAHMFEYSNEWGDKRYAITKQNRQLISEWYTGRCFLYDSSVATDERDNLVDVLEKAVMRYGCDVVLVDNLMTALDLDNSNDRDKYEKQSLFVKKLTRMALRHNVIILLVAHKRKNNFTQDANDEISGSGDIANLGMVTLSYERSDDIDPSERLLKVAKNRLFGNLNLDGWIMNYDPVSKRVYFDAKEASLEYGWTKMISQPLSPQSDGFSEINMEIEQEDVPFD